MFWLQAAVLGISAATSLLGKRKERQAQREQARAQAAIAGEQTAITGLQNKSLVAASNLGKRLTAISKRQEYARRQTLRFENISARREIIRNAQLARSTIVSKASNSGALQSSGFQGAQSAVAQGAAEQQNTRRFNFDQGRLNFALNNDILRAQTLNADTQTNLNLQINNRSNNITALGGQANLAGAKADFGRSLFQTGIQLAQSSGSTANTLASLPGLFK